MNIPISPELGILLLVLFIGYMLYTNREVIRTRSTRGGQAFFVGIVLTEVAIIVGSRAVVPPVLAGVIDRSSALYDLVDVGVFIALVFGVLAVGRKIKERIA